MPTKILALHHVQPEPELPVGPDVTRSVTPDRLLACIEAHRDWTFVDHDQALTTSDAKPRVLVTFDDGYRDVLTTALPILEAHDVPCLLFVVTGYLDGTTRPLETDVAWLASRLHPDERAGFYRRHSRQLRHESPIEQVERIQALARENGLPDPPVQRERFLAWDDVIELSRHPLVTIGSHTVTHHMLTAMQMKRAIREATASKSRLEERLGQAVECFAFPYGRQSMMVRRAVARAGYRFAFTTRGRVIDRVNRVDPMAVPRFAVDEDGDWGPCDIDASAPRAIRAAA